MAPSSFPSRRMESSKRGHNARCWHKTDIAFVVRKEVFFTRGRLTGNCLKAICYWHLEDGDFAAEHDCSSEFAGEAAMLSRVSANVSPGIADTSDFENTFITITPAVMRPIPTNAGMSSVCLAQTQATAVIKTIPNPDQMAYTMPVGIVRSGNARSQNAATKQKIDMMLGTSLERPWDAASAVVPITSVMTAPAKHK